ncbi:MAG: amidohydrolase, partial [Pedobacter sp.]
MKNRILFVFAIMITTQLYAQQKKAEKLVVGKIWTGNPAQPWAEAMAFSGDNILAVGTINQVASFVDDKTIKITAPTHGLIVPGFIDSHTHFIDGGLKLSGVQLREAKTKQEFIKRIGDFAKTLQPGEWITGGSWDHQNWGGELPEKSWIDSVTKNNPVYINRLDGHMLLANTAALKLAGVNDSVKDVDGGEIIRRDGHVTGLLKDNAKSLVNDVMPLPSEKQKEDALKAAMAYVASNGITSISSLTGTGFGDYFDVYQSGKAKGLLITRINAVSELENYTKLAEFIKKNGAGDKWLRYGGVKGFVDGSLGSHTAAFLKPFTDSPSDSGFFVITEKLLYSRLKSADSLGLQLLVHAIGDRSIHSL